MIQIEKLKPQKKLNAYISLVRPKQWIKNLFVFSAVIFSRNMFNLVFLEKSFLTFISFCLISSCVYILNDIVDIEKDKKHPKKKYRPLASGAVSRTEAIMLIILLVPFAVMFSFQNGKALGVIILLYFINNLAYSFKVKQIVIVDVMSIAIGFLLRVIGGAISINVEISPWLLLCTLLLSLFLGFSKRRNELLLLETNADKHRRALGDYSLEFIDSMLSIVTASTVMAYSLYTFSATDNSYMMLTIPFVLYGIFRYQYIIYMKNEGGTPEDTVIEDKPLMIDILLWIATSILILYF